MKAIRGLIKLTFDYQETNPRFSRLVSIENIQSEVHMAQSEKIQKLNSAIVETLAIILERAQESVFRGEVNAVEAHADQRFLLRPVSNHHTFGLLFRRDLSDLALRGPHKQQVAASVLHTLERHTEQAGRNSEEESGKAVGERKESRRRAAA